MRWPSDVLRQPSGRIAVRNLGAQPRNRGAVGNVWRNGHGFKQAERGLPDRRGPVLETLAGTYFREAAGIHR